MTDDATTEAENLLKTIHDETAAEVEETFDLDEAVDTGIILRERKVTVYRNQKAAEELGGFEDKQTLLGTTQRERWGLLGKLDERRTAKIELEKDNEDGRFDASIQILADEIDALIEEIAPVAEALKASALTLELRAVPPVILKDTRRRARKELGIKGKNIPEDRMEEYEDLQQAELLSDMLVSVVDGRGRKPSRQPDVAWALKLRQRLHESEYGRIDRLVGEIQYRGAVANSIAESGDFSLGI
jgi:hypothetical protein